MSTGILSPGSMSSGPSPTLSTAELSDEHSLAPSQRCSACARAAPAAAMKRCTTCCLVVYCVSCATSHPHPRLHALTAPPVPALPARAPCAAHERVRAAARARIRGGVGRALPRRAVRARARPRRGAHAVRVDAAYAWLALPCDGAARAARVHRACGRGGVRVCEGAHERLPLPYDGSRHGVRARQLDGGRKAQGNKLLCIPLQPASAHRKDLRDGCRVPKDDCREHVGLVDERRLDWPAELPYARGIPTLLADVLGGASKRRREGRLGRVDTSVGVISRDLMDCVMAAVLCLLVIC